jgi:hypothetical protein
MRAARLIVFVIFGALLAIAAVIDRSPRPQAVITASLRPAVPTAGGSTVTWYCTGGSGPDGIAEVGLELINTSTATRRASVTGLPGGRISVEGSMVELDLAAGERASVAPADLAPGALFVGAVVEVDGPGVVVEQSLISGTIGADRSPCSTRTDSLWIVPSGATRFEAEGERMVIMMLNPFPDDAVVNIAFVADVGLDDLDGIVIPAGEVAAIDVTDEVTVAASVSAVIDVVSGRISVSRIQALSGPTAGRGLRATPATPAGAPLWYLPIVEVRPGRSDVVSVTNPDPDRVAEVDIEIIAHRPGVLVDPIELTVRPGRTVAVDLAAEARLADVEAATLVIRSLDGLPVAVDLATTVHSGGALVAGASGAIGLDAASDEWIVLLESMAEHMESQLVVVNPSTVAIAIVELIVDGVPVRSAEVGPTRRLAIPAAELGDGRFVVRIVSSAPVIAARELVGLTSRSAATGVAVGELVDFANLP